MPDQMMNSIWVSPLDDEYKRIKSDSHTHTMYKN